MIVNLDLRFAKRGQVERIESIPIVAKLTIENTSFPDALDLHEFVLSLTQSGLRPLFTCAVCGTFGCEGYYALIEHTPQSYVINGTYTYLKPTELMHDILYEILWWQISKIMKQIRGSLLSIPHNHSYLEKYVSQFGFDKIDESISLIALRTTPQRGQESE